VRNLGVLAAIPAIAETVGAQNAAGVNDNVLPDNDALPNHNIREEFAIRSEHYIAADVHVGVQRAFGSDLGSLTDDDVWPDSAGRINTCTGSDFGGWINARVNLF
jgi:hypothetical protein